MSTISQTPSRRSFVTTLAAAAPTAAIASAGLPESVIAAPGPDPIFAVISAAKAAIVEGGCCTQSQRRPRRHVARGG
jgi:hypothetical protein